MTKIDRDTIVVLGVAALYVACCSNAEAVESDKAKHVAVSAVMAAAATVALEGRTENPVLYGAAASFVVGAAKEAYDKRHYDANHPKRHTASNADLVADLVGATAGAWLGHGVYVQADGGSVSFGVSKDF